MERAAPARTAEQIAAALRLRILDGALTDDFPKQDDLVAEFGVSYPSVREALRILETEGFITVRRGNRGGATVHPPDIGTAGYALGLTLQALQVPVPDLGGAIGVLEPLSAAHCAERPDRATAVVPRLEALLEEGRRTLEDGAEFTRASREFHDAVVDLEPNATLRVVMRSLATLWTVQEEAWARTEVSRGAYPSATERRAGQRAHERLVAAIAAGDAAESSRLSARHLTETQRWVLKTLQERTIDAASPQSRVRFRRGQGGQV